MALVMEPNPQMVLASRRFGSAASFTEYQLPITSTKSDSTLWSGSTTARSHSRRGVYQLEVQNRNERDREGARAVVEPFLRKHGFSDVNAERRRLRKQCPLHYAVRKNDAQLVRQLVIAGADLKLTDSTGKTPLDIAQEKDHHGSHTMVLAALMPPRRARSASVPVRSQSRIGLRRMAV